MVVARTGGNKMKTEEEGRAVGTAPDNRRTVVKQRRAWVRLIESFRGTVSMCKQPVNIRCRLLRPAPERDRDTVFYP